MSITIPNQIYKRAAAICDDFPIIDFVTIVSIIYADTLHEANKPDPFAPAVSPNIEPVKVTKSEQTPATLDNKDMDGTGLQWTNATAPTKKKTYHRRRREKLFVVDGKEYRIGNMKEIFRIFAVDKKDYDYIVKKFTVTTHKDDIVEYEAKLLKKALEKIGHTLTVYNAYDFKDQWTQIKLDEVKA